MRRWNGWGDDTITWPLSMEALQTVSRLLGTGTSPHDATLAEVIATVPATRLSSHPLVSTEPFDRLCHARGQSFPDLIALRTGRIGEFPDGVAYPRSAEEVRSLLAYAHNVGAQVIAYGGGTSVVGHINPQPGSAAVLTVDLSRLNRLLDLQPESRLATFGAGIAGPDLEAQLRAHGSTLGHFPQSFERSTLGGWIATRSSGQQSLGYGRIEQLFAGGHVETPVGPLPLRSVPASAAGPDLRQLILGSEGRLGILTEATVRLSPWPEHEAFYAVFFPDRARAYAAVRALAQSRVRLSMLRLSLPEETATTLAFAHDRRSVTLLETYLALHHIREEKCLLLIGLTGDRFVFDHGRRFVQEVTGDYKGVHVGERLGWQWQKGRFRAPYWRNELWERGYAVETVETATTWDNVSTLVERLEIVVRSGLADRGERVHAFTHLSHVYPTGSSIYTTFLFRLGQDGDDTYDRWHTLKSIASETIIANGGTISHHHGVGAEHRPYMEAEKGATGVAALRHIIAGFDPEGMLNPGKLV